jgi:hypothetical protein
MHLVIHIVLQNVSCKRGGTEIKGYTTAADDVNIPNGIVHTAKGKQEL